LRSLSDPRAIDRRIVALAVPAVLSVIADPLYDLTDTAILGHLGRAQLGGAALASAVLTTAYAVFIFLLFGTTAQVARLLGARRHAEATHLGVQGIWLGVALGTVAGVLLWVFAPWLISLFGGEGAVGGFALTYLRVSTVGLPGFFVVMASTGYLRGIQDLRTPLLVVVATALFNLVAEVLLIIVLGFGVGASALTTAVAKTVAGLVLASMVAKAARAQHISLRPDRAALRGLSATGLPLFVRTVALRAMFAGALIAAGRLGEVDLAGYAVGIQVFMFVAYLYEGYEVAAQTLVGEQAGRGDRAGVLLVGRRIMRLGVISGVVLAVALVLARPFLPALFSSDPAVRNVIAASLLWVACAQPFGAVAFTLDGILIGLADLGFLALSMVAIAASAGLALWITVRLGADVGWVWVTVVGSLLARAVILGRRFFGGRAAWT
jgi:putative MATE family efflux protein